MAKKSETKKTVKKKSPVKKTKVTSKAASRSTKKPTVKKTAAKTKSASTKRNSSTKSVVKSDRKVLGSKENYRKTLLIAAGIFAVFVVFMAAIAGLVLFVLPQTPAGFEKYDDNDLISFAYPEEYEVEDFGTRIDIVNPNNPEISDVEELDNEFIPEMSIGYVSPTENAAAQLNCESLSSQIDILREDENYTIKSEENIEVNDYDGCFVDFYESESDSRSALYLLQGDDESALFITLSQIGEESKSEFDDLKKVVDTISLKD